jgi:2,4-dichlorophenol 6-monooxygenase
MTENENLETDVLIIGSGPAGGGAALALATYGVDHMVITKYRWTANTPRAHITNQRTMEVFRDLGIEPDVWAQAVPHELMGETVFCTSLAGDEIGRVRTWGTHPARDADYTMASPSQNCDIPQTLLEPIVIGHAASRGSRIRFDTEYVSLVQDDDGATVTVRDRVTGQTYDIRAKYVIGADGGRSRVAEDVGLPFEGQMDLAGSMNIVFHADLSHLVEHRPSVLYWVLQPGSDVGGIGLGLVRMVRPWNEWLIVWGYDIGQPPPDVDDEMATRIVHELVGDDTVAVTIRSTSLASSGRELPPPALSEPYVTVSRHTAPTVRRRVEGRRYQCANKVGWRRRTVSSHLRARVGLPRSRLNFCMAHRTRCSSMRPAREYNMER